MFLTFSLFPSDPAPGPFRSVAAALGRSLRFVGGWRRRLAHAEVHRLTVSGENHGARCWGGVDDSHLRRPDQMCWVLLLWAAESLVRGHAATDVFTVVRGSPRL